VEGWGRGVEVRRRVGEGMGEGRGVGEGRGWG
jgi:hypothetical protein